MLLHSTIIFGILAFNTVISRKFIARRKLKHNDDQSYNIQEYFDMRCVRRFLPGVCSHANLPVWTYVFHLHNCSERLGCPEGMRTNRFQSYLKCLRFCSTFTEDDIAFMLRNKHQPTRDGVDHVGNKMRLKIPHQEAGYRLPSNQATFEDSPPNHLY